MKTKAIIVDLDGTLANCLHRIHHVTGSKKDFDAFYAGIPNDVPNEWCLDLVTKYYTIGPRVLFVSGRSEKCRDATLEFLYQKCGLVWFEDEVVLFMRKENDYREDWIVKEEIFKQDIEPYFDILFAVDDRQQVVDMWRRNGIVCLQCAKGDF